MRSPTASRPLTINVNYETADLKLLLQRPKSDIVFDHTLFIRFVTLCCNLGEITQDSLAACINISAGYFNRMYHRTVKKLFTEEQRDNIYDHLVNAKGINAIVAKLSYGVLAPEESAFYEAFSDYYLISPTARKLLEEEAIGTFVLWRWSTEVGGDPLSSTPSRAIVRGRVDFVLDNDTQSVKAIMTQAMRDIGETKANSLLKAENKWESYGGFLFLRSNKYIMILKNKIKSDFRVTIFYSDPRDSDTGKITALKGIGMGMDAGRLFVSPVYLERCENDSAEGLQDTLGRYEFGDVPTRIQKILREQPFILI